MCERERERERECVSETTLHTCHMQKLDTTYNQVCTESGCTCLLSTAIMPTNALTYLQLLTLAHICNLLLKLTLEFKCHQLL